MDGIIINELSLSGQFHDSQDFWKNGMPPFTKHCRMLVRSEWGICSNKEVFTGHKPLPTRLFMIC